jgi:RHS repeat-associated protein
VLPTPGGNPGQFTVYAQHTWTSANSFTVQTTITDIAGATASPSASATVAASTTSLSATEGTSYSGVVASFIGNPANAQSATIVWGDGTANSSSTIVSTGQNSFNVTTSGHTYADDGVYNLSVTVTMSPGPNLSAAGPAVVADAALSGTANNLSPVVSQPLGLVPGQSEAAVTIATFTDANTAATAADFALSSVSWGDGTTSTPIIVAGSPAGTFNVVADHTYVHPGSFTVTTTVLDKGSMATNLQATATVGVPGGQPTMPVLTLSLPDPVTTLPPAAYTATLVWGDGSPNSTAVATPVYSYSGGTLTGSLQVTAAHSYAAAGTYTVTATATNPNTHNSSTGTVSLTVADALLNPLPQPLTAGAGTSTGTITVAQFEDDNSLATAGQFTTVTVNWGDGSGNQSGTLVATSNPGLFSIQASHNYANPGNYSITSTATKASGRSVTVNSPMLITSGWSVITSPTLPVTTGGLSADPDRAYLVPLGEASVDLNQGAIRISHSLDFDISPGTRMGGTPPLDVDIGPADGMEINPNVDVGSGPALDYNSATTSPRPVIQLVLASDPNAADPPPISFQVAWSFNGVGQPTQTFGISNYQAGKPYLMGVQVANPVTATGVYGWSATITITLQSGPPVVLTTSGYLPVVVRDASPYGAGWGIRTIDQLYPISANGPVPAGVLWVSGSGDARFYLQNGTTYTSPEDYGSLVAAGGGWQYTSTHGSVWTFNGSGLLTSVVHPSTLAMNYVYTGGLLTTVNNNNDLSTATLTYDGHGILQSITEPGSGRILNFTQNEVNVGGTWQSTLTQIADVDNTTRGLTYNSLHQLTSDSWSPLASAFGYTLATGLVSTVTLGQGSTLPYAILPEAANSLVSSVVPIDPSVLSGPPAKITDGNSHTTQYAMDLRDRLLRLTDPLGNITADEVNVAGDPIYSRDPLAKITSFGYTAAGDVSQIIYPDGSYHKYQYDLGVHEVTQDTNALGETTLYAYAQDLLSSITDPLGDTTSFGWQTGRMISEIDPLHHTTLYHYDAHRRLIAVIDPLGNVTRTSYDANGNVAADTDALGYTTAYVNNARGMVTQTGNPDGGTVKDQYYADGELQTDTNARGFASTTTIDSRGLVVSATDYTGASTSYGYDYAGNETSVTDPDTNTWTYQYDADNRQTRAITPLNEISQTQYDGDSNVTATIDPLGFTTTYNYNLLNQEVLTVDPMGRIEATAWSNTGEHLATIDKSGNEWRTLYDAAERVTATLDPLQDTTRFQLDADSNVTATIDPRGYTTTFKYDADDRRTLATDPNGNNTAWGYDADSQNTQVTDGNGHTTKYGYDPMGRDNAVTGAGGHTWSTFFYPTGSVYGTFDANNNPPTTFTRDGEDRPLTEKDPAGNVSRMAYDPAGLLTATTRPSGATTDYLYNADEVQDVTIDPIGHVWSKALDAASQVVAQYDPLLHGTFYGYDGDGEDVRTNLSTGALTRFAYTGVSDVAQETDPDGNITLTYYDKAERTVGGRDPLGNQTLRAYNADSEVTQQVDADSRQITSTYDPGDRLTSQVWILANLSQADVFNFSYDHADNLTSAGDNYGSYGYTLDPADRITHQTDPFALGLSFTYDGNGNATQVADSAGGTDTSVYNPDNLLTSRRLSGGPNNSQLRMDIAYTPDNLIDHLNRYSDTAGSNLVGKTQNTYDANANLTETKHTNGSTTTLQDFQYNYDAANRLTSQTDTISGVATTTNFGYDASDQLTSAGASNFNWDANGNATNSGDQVGPANQLLNDGTWKYSYDPAGNEVTKVGVAGGPDAGISWVYTYDNVNHLLTATETVNGTQRLQETNFYDVYGNRVELDVTQSGTTTVTKFAYNEVSGNGNIWADLNSSNQVQTRRAYLDAMDAVFARISSSGYVNWYLTDHLGSVRGLAGNAGALDDALSYNVWGSVTSESTPANADRYKYAGYELDPSTGLYHVRARWFDPVAVRWVSQDPLGLSPDSNPYRYTANAPTLAVDPTGQFLWFAGMAVAAVLFGAQVANAPGPGDRTYGYNEFGCALGGVLQATGPKFLIAGPARGLAVIGAGMGLVIQGGQIADGNRKKLDLGELAADACLGPLIGAAMGSSKCVTWFLSSWMLAEANESIQAGNVWEGLTQAATGALPVLLQQDLIRFRAAPKAGRNGEPPPRAPEDTGQRRSPPPSDAPAKLGNPNAARPAIETSLPDRVTKALPEGAGRTAAEKAQARNFYKRNIDEGRLWWEQRTGKQWPVDPKTGKPQWAEHPRPLKDGGDPLFIKPGVGPDPNAPHLNVGPDGLTDQQRWGRMGGRPKKNP